MTATRLQSGWVSVSTLGLPRYWLTVWEALHGGDLQESTLGARLATIDFFYRYVEEVTGQDCLDQVMASIDLVRLEALLAGALSRLRNDSTHTGHDSVRDWRGMFGFVRDIIERLGGPDMEIFRARIERLTRLYGSLSPSRTPKRRVVRALPAAVIDDLYEIIDPGSPRNPFRSEGQRWRNYALFVLYLHQGLRRSEALILPVNAVNEGVDPESGRVFRWLNVVNTCDEPDDIADQRTDKPRLKTVQSQRQIPISEELASIIDHYNNNYRGRQPHTLLFPSNRNTPLAKRSVNCSFTVLLSCLSDGAQSNCPPTPSG
jgi:integrase